MPPPDEELSPAEMRRWLVRLETQMVSGFEKVDRRFGHMEQRFDAVQETIGSLAFVRKDVYDAEMRAMREYNAETRTAARGARVLALWCLAAVSTSVIASAIALLTLVAG